MAMRKEHWQIVGFAVAIAIIAYFLAHGCSKKASAATTDARARGAADANFDVVIAGAIMPYRQPRPEIRRALIVYLRELH